MTNGGLVPLRPLLGTVCETSTKLAAGTGEV